MIDRFKCNMSEASIRLDGNDQPRCDLLLVRIVERGSGNIHKQQPNRGDVERGRKCGFFGLFLQTRCAAFD
jgi:hypothetical protein